MTIGPLSPAEAHVLYKPTGNTVNFERFCETHPYRVVGPEKLPERRFRTLICAAQTVLEAGRQFHVECGAFKASYMECRSLIREHEEALQFEEARHKAGYWEKIGAEK